jgi:energy-coupling factor transport system substrate-specific component
METGEQKINSEKRGKGIMLTTKNVVLTGFLAAALTAGKLALAFVPNVEIVTVLILVYATVFGFRAVFAVLIFCTVEILLYGFGTWVYLYYIYWSALCAIACVLLKRPRPVAAAIYAVIMTFLFGIIDTVINVVFAALAGVPRYQLLNLFIGYYARGIWFCAVHIVSNALVVSALYRPLVAAISKLSLKIKE